MNTTFTFNNATYEITPNGYYYKTVGNKKTRCSLKAFEAARNAAIAEAQLDAMAEDPEVSLDQFAEAVTLNEHGCIICRDCPMKDCVHRDCMRRNPEEIGGLGLCPRWIAQGKTTLDVSRDLWDEMLADAEDELVAADEQAILEQEVYTPAPKKTRKARKSKDVAYTYSENGKPVVTLTAKQVDFVKHLPDTNFWEHGLDSEIWVDVLCDEIGGQFAKKPMTVGAMISTLCEKGLGQRAKSRINGKLATSFALTELGKTVFATGWGLN